ncbi:VCBS domain-containing protein [Massilia sp. TWP1-3-3]|uniref:VCBS domain-containing protein n=1 Tax=Massilia sp. TWP1-3-3 TaxID=2804573 RepID=UPI003CE9CA29
MAATQASAASGLTLAGDGSYRYLLDNVAAQALAAGTTVTERFGYLVTDGLAQAASALVVTISGSNDAPTVVADVAAVASVGDGDVVTASGNVLSNDSDVDAGAVLGVANPGTYEGAFGSLTLGADGSYSYVLNAQAARALAEGMVATDTFGYRATDGMLTSSSVLVVTITGSNDAPTVTADSAAVTEDTSVTASGNVLANDRDADANTVLRVANAGAYTGTYGSLTLGADGSYSYALDDVAAQALAEGSVVTDVFRYVASDGAIERASELVVTIAGSNDTPTLSADVAAVTEDVPVAASGNVLANDRDADSGTQLTVVNPGIYTGLFGFLRLGADGSYGYVLDNVAAQKLAGGAVVTETFVYVASDGIVNTESRLVVSITGANDAVVVAADTASLSEDGVVTAAGNVLANDRDVDAGSVLALANPGQYNGNYGSLTLMADGSYRYLLDNAKAQALGEGKVVTDTFTYLATDGALQSAGVLVLSITGSNDAPTAVADAAAVAEDGSVTAAGNVLANDRDVDSGAVLAVANPGTYKGAYGSLTLVASGGYSYALDNVAAQALAGGALVTDSFVYLITDGLVQTGGKLVVSISGDNDAPTVVADVAAVTEDSKLTAGGNVLANDRDVDSGALLSVAAPGAFAGAYGRLALAADGSYTYTLENAAVQSLAGGQVVTDTFNYGASDGAVQTAGKLVVSVTGTNDAPTVVADKAAVHEDTVLTASGNVLANDSDVDAGAVLSVANAGTYQGAFGSLSLAANGSYTYALDNVAAQVLAEGALVTDTFSYVATDGVATTGSQLVVSITGSRDALSVTADVAAVSEDRTLTASGNVLVNDVGTALTVSSAGVFQGKYGALNLQKDGSYRYTLNNGAAAVQALGSAQGLDDVFAYSATDGFDTRASTLSVRISGTNDAPDAVEDVALAAEDQLAPVTGNVLTNDTDADAGTVLTVSTVGALAGTYGSLTLQANGAYSYALDNARATVQALAAGQTVYETFAYAIVDNDPTATAADRATLRVAVSGRNDAPLLVNKLDDKQLAANTAFSYQVDAAAFQDVDKTDVLLYSATLADGKALPQWLRFDAPSRTFSGLMPASATETVLGLRVIATDPAGAFAKGDFTLKVAGAPVRLVLNGTPRDDVLTGSNYNDIIDGKQGCDLMTGRKGDDIYYVDAVQGGCDDDDDDDGHDYCAWQIASRRGDNERDDEDDDCRDERHPDVVVEKANEGYDTVYSSVSYTLAANVEQLRLLGYADLDGAGNSLDNKLVGNGGQNQLDGGAGNDWLQGGNGADRLTDLAGNNTLDGGAGNDVLTGGAGVELLIGDDGDDVITTGYGADVIAFNRGDGKDTVTASSGADNTISLGHGIKYADLRFAKSKKDLILLTGANEQVTFKDWYASGSNHSVANLQIVIEGTSDYDARSPNKLNNAKIEVFNFDGLVSQFDKALAANAQLTNWSLSSSLLNFHLSGSNSVAIGGNLVYQYGLSDSVETVVPAASAAALNVFGLSKNRQQDAMMSDSMRGVF